ncbi:TOMM precursor leader peptide-binding protein [Streptomyces sp. MUM 203J]|uniref:TOMM precursor leader peptide-binding protein n=1 Tax=Streptomyces sp. MUM 203J TaxID=2791990 RepID=UPI001F047C0B|nr:TOMM precursor leader peptide-binding protein [Streptomyces sp. MUM 203J]MCH0538182.1 TOMM precursor leader peptide-binding protein [Streptomyces sp. MUM 203J]
MADTTFDALAPTRPRIRRDVLFTETPGGVLFHNADGGFHLTGRTAYRFASLLVPHLAGHHRLGDICQGFGPAQRAMAAELVKTLYEREFARDIPEAEAADEAADSTVTRRFAAQIGYVDHYADGAPERFGRFRDTRVAVLGDDEVARWCALSLVRNGCARVAVTALSADLVAEAAALDEDGCPVLLDQLTAGSGWPELTSYDTVVVTGPDAAGTTRRLLAEGVPDGVTLIPSWPFGGHAVTGPLVTATSAGCWTCAVLRLGGNADAGAAADLWATVTGDVTPPSGRALPTGPVAAMTGNLLGYEVFRLATGALPPETDRQILVQDLESLDVMAEPVQPHPRCRRCAPLVPAGDPGLPEALTLPVTPTVETARQAEALVDDLNRISGALVRPYSGIFKRYDDEEITQTPLKVSRVEVALGHGERRRIAAFDVHHLAGARMRALYAAAETYVEHVVPVDPGTPGTDGVTALGPDRLTTGGGTGARVTDWTAAASLLTKEPVRVPTAAVRPFGERNRDRVHLATRAGAGAGGTPQEAAGRALMSALSHDALLRAVRGTTEVRPLATAQEDDPELVFLLKSAGTLGVDAELLDLGEAARTTAHVVLARSGDGRWAVGAELSRRAAACAALRDLLGQAQLAAEDPETEVDPGDPLLADLAPGTVAVTGEAVPPDGPATDFPSVLDRLRAAGRDALYVRTTPADLPAGGISTAYVLLTTGPEAGAHAHG